MGEPNPNKKCAKELAAVIILLHESNMTHAVWCWYFSIPFIFKLCCTNSVLLCQLLLWLHNISLNTLAHTFSQHSIWHRKTLNPSEFPECWSFSCFYGRKGQLVCFSETPSSTTLCLIFPKRQQTLWFKDCVVTAVGDQCNPSWEPHSLCIAFLGCICFVHCWLQSIVFALLNGKYQTEANKQLRKELAVFGWASCLQTLGVPLIRQSIRNYC